MEDAERREARELIAMFDAGQKMPADLTQEKWDQAEREHIKADVQASKPISDAELDAIYEAHSSPYLRESAQFDHRPTITPEQIEKLKIKLTPEQEAAFRREENAHGFGDLNALAFKDYKTTPKLATDMLISGEAKTVVRTTYQIDGTPLVHKWEALPDCKTRYTAPDGTQTVKSEWAARKIEIAHLDRVNLNTRGLIAAMKDDNSITMRQGDKTYSVAGDKLIMDRDDGKRVVMPLAKFEAHLTERGEEIRRLKERAGMREQLPAMSMVGRGMKTVEEGKADLKQAMMKRAEAAAVAVRGRNTEQAKGAEQGA